MKKLTSVARYNESRSIANEGQGAWNGLLILIGIGLCFTGIGAFVGVPLIVIVFINQIKGNETIKGSWEGDCPKCNNIIFWHSGTKDTKQGNFNCPTCNVDIDFYENKFIHRNKA
ncbi:MAG: hypothetical protein GY823_07565 [Flavobacteriaceae bacterium]|nr:hypothetical protein [Flavobacteriaceae bacterium]